jgi:hypothetical protein
MRLVVSQRGKSRADPCVWQFHVANSETFQTLKLASAPSNVVQCDRSGTSRWGTRAFAPCSQTNKPVTKHARNDRYARKMQTQLSAEQCSFMLGGIIPMGVGENIRHLTLVRLPWVGHVRWQLCVSERCQLCVRCLLCVCAANATAPQVYVMLMSYVSIQCLLYFCLKGSA